MFHKLKKWNLIKQKTEKWLLERLKVITASDVSSILEINPYTSKYDVLQKKINKSTTVIETEATKWGEYHEPLAKKYYENMSLLEGKRKVHDVGLIHHYKYDWLAASPDGIVEGLEEKKWWLLEIKCPYKRVFDNKGEKIPSYIWTQTQIQMEVCNLQFCHLLQCKYDKINNKSYLVKKRLTTIKRDTDWFNNIAYPKLHNFYLLMNKSKNNKNFINPYPNQKKWVSLTSFNGYLLKDPLIDFLNIYKNDSFISNMKNNKKISNSNSKKINLFKTIFNKLFKFSVKNNLKIIYVSNISEGYNESLSTSKYNITKNALDQNIDIIIRPVLLDLFTKTYGMPDFIIKEDVLSLFLEDVEQDSKMLKGDGYVTCSLVLRNKINKISKWDKLILTHNTAYSNIITKITKKETKICLLSSSDSYILNYDENKLNDINNGIKWINKIRQNGDIWLKDIYSGNIPSNKNLMPNMCNKYDGKWKNIKKYFAEKWGELTLLWYCGIKQRNLAHQKGIYSWKDPKYTTNEILNSLYTQNSLSKRKHILESMIELNKEGGKVYNSRVLKEPFIDTHNAIEVYIDFEVLSGKNINNNYSERLKTPQNIIYLIGMQWVVDGKEEFKSFTSETLTEKGEKDMLKSWWSYVKKLREGYDKVILYHWSPAEERFLSKSLSRYPSLNYINNNLISGKYDFRDLMDMFIDAEVVIRNVWGYSVKDIAKGLFNFGLISEVWNDNEKGGDNITSGKGTLTAATKCYKEIKNNGLTIKNNPNFRPLIEYNQMDCNVLQHLLSFLRNFVYTKDIKINNKKRSKKLKRKKLNLKRKKIK